MASQWRAQDKNFLITGGASGLGAEYAEAFLKEGAKNIVIADIAEELGKATAERLNKTYPKRVLFVKCDVSEENNIQKAFNETVDKLKQIDVLINNAGIMNDAPSAFRSACDVNWQGLISFTLKAINHMSKKEGGVGGTIINISSTAALTKFPFLPIYNGSKLAVLHFSQCIAMDPFYEQTGVRVLVMCFGPTDTPLLHSLEKRCYNENLGVAFKQLVGDAQVDYQKVELAVAAFLEMFKIGTSGSIWLSTHNKPVKEITSTVDKVFGELNSLFN